MTIATERAIELINSATYRHGWAFEAREFDRFADAVSVRVQYPAHNYNRDQAPDYPQALTLAPEFPILLGDCDCDEDVLFELSKVLLRIEEHEMREALRVPTDGGWHAPFHPHNLPTMREWARRSGSDVRDDLTFAAL